VLDTSFNTAVVGENSYVFNKDSGNLARMLEELARKPDEVRQAGERAKAHAQTHFNWDAVAREHERLFSAIVADKGRR